MPPLAAAVPRIGEAEASVIAEASQSGPAGAQDEPAIAAVTWSARIATLASWTRRALVAPAHWRAAVVASCLVAAAVATPVYWSTWTGVLTRQVGVGQHALSRGRRTLVAQVGSRSVVPAGKIGRTPPSSAAGTLHVESEPAGAQVLVDGKDRGVTPVDVPDLAPGTHTVRLKTESGVIDRSVRIAAGKTTDVREAIYSGWLHVSAPFEVDIAEGTKRFTLDDSSQTLLSPGLHELTFENRALGFRDVQRVSIRPGGTTSVTLAPPPGLLSVTSSEPAEVMVDGEAVGATPLADLPTRIGTRDITVTAASGAVRRLTMTVTTGPVRVDVDFTRP